MCPLKAFMSHRGRLGWSRTSGLRQSGAEPTLGPSGPPMCACALVVPQTTPMTHICAKRAHKKSTSSGHPEGGQSGPPTGGSGGREPPRIRRGVWGRPSERPFEEPFEESIGHKKAPTRHVVPERSSSRPFRGGSTIKTSAFGKLLTWLAAPPRR